MYLNTVYHDIRYDQSLSAFIHYFTHCLTSVLYLLAFKLVSMSSSSLFGLLAMSLRRLLCLGILPNILNRVLHAVLNSHNQPKAYAPQHSSVARRALAGSRTSYL